jgi:hypothetical protein
LLEVAAGGEMAAFCRLFRPENVAVELPGPEGRVAAFDARNVGAYAEFVKRGRRDDSVLGSPAQRLSWVADTLRAPDEIWRLEGTPRSTEIFASRYELANDRRILFVVIAHADEQEGGRRVEPRRWQLCTGPLDDAWKKLLTGARQCWPAGQAIEAAAVERTRISVAVLFGRITNRIDADSWSRRFLQLEAENPVDLRVEYVAPQRFPKGKFDYWLLDTNTTAHHYDFRYPFNDSARQAGAFPLAMETPSALVLVRTATGVYRLTAFGWHNG